MKKVLLLGDSIRISYQSLVKEKLQGMADVVWPEENCRFVKYTLWYAKIWMEQLGKPDIIHWNNGIWDVYRISDEVGIFTGLEEYVRDLGRTLTELKKTQAQIIWATTTAVADRYPICQNKDVDCYNAAANELMRGEGVAIDDLNAIVRSNAGLYIGEDCVHLTEEGERACAQAVAGCVMRYLC